MAAEEHWSPELKDLDNDDRYQRFAKYYSTGTKEYFKRQWFITQIRKDKVIDELKEENKNLEVSLDVATNQLHKREELLKKFELFKQLGVELFGDAIENMVAPMIEKAGYEVEERMNESAYERRIGLEA